MAVRCDLKCSLCHVLVVIKVFFFFNFSAWIKVHMSVAFRNNSTPSTPSALVSGEWAKREQWQLAGRPMSKFSKENQFECSSIKTAVAPRCQSWRTSDVLCSVGWHSVVASQALHTFCLHYVLAHRCSTVKFGALVVEAVLTQLRGSSAAVSG